MAMEIQYSLFGFMDKIICRLKENGRLRTSETYRSTLNSFRRFRHNRDIDLRRLDCHVVEAYEAWLRNRGLVPNSTSFYLRILRATYNRAVELQHIRNRRPFRHVYTGVDRTVKRALPLNTLRRIRALDLSRRPKMEYARDMFMLSFYLRGMSFVDMAFLRKSDLRRGKIEYRRRKTGQKLSVAWTREMQQIIEKYPPNSSAYLLPIIRREDYNEIYAYRNAGYMINYNLKRIASLAGISVPLTLYVARHSWASIARASGIPLSVISEGMGHESEATTRIYLANLDTAVVDRANARILRMI